MFRTHCLICRNTTLSEIINLGMHPMADTFVAKNRESEADRVYPLVCDLCSDCGHIQLRTITRPEERYVEADYSYTSSNSATSRMYWTNYSRYVSERVALPPGAMVVEIGSNDGFLTAEFAALGHPALGIDPSPVMAKLAASRNVETVVGLFGETIAQDIRGKCGELPQLIVANNVFNHANEPVDFVLGVKHLLAPEGTFVFEFPYWLRSIEQKKFDQIYHEHVSYFTLSSCERLFRLCGMHVADVEMTEYHGGSIRIYVQHGVRDALPDSARGVLEAERAAGLFDPSTYNRLMAEVVRGRDIFLANIYGLRGAGSRIVCVGAAAKGNTFLNYYNLDGSVIDCVTDSSPSKQGKLTPRTRIPILPDAALARYDAVYAIILSWNISTALRESLAKINPRITFLNPYEAMK